MPANTIERRLDEWRDLAYTGVPYEAISSDPDYDTYVRAFRLKRFFRCPACDDAVIEVMSEDFLRMGWHLGCRSCRWAVFVWDVVSRDPDDCIIDIVRGVPKMKHRR